MEGRSRIERLRLKRSMLSKLEVSRSKKHGLIISGRRFLYFTDRGTWGDANRDIKRLKERKFQVDMSPYKGFLGMTFWRVFYRRTPDSLSLPKR